MKSSNVNQTSVNEALNRLVCGEYETKAEAHAFIFLFAQSLLEEPSLFEDCLNTSFEKYKSDELSLRRVGYLFDFLTRFLAQEKTRKLRLREQIKNVKLSLANIEGTKKKSTYCFYENETPNPLSIDELANIWGLEAGIHASKLKELLDLQRRVTAKTPS